MQQVEEKRSIFRTSFAQSIFDQKYKHKYAEDWPTLSKTLVLDVCFGLLPESKINRLTELHTQMKFIAGGRYLYYAGRLHKFFNNCYLLRALEDSREDWAELSGKSEHCLMTGGGIGVDYSIYRPRNRDINKTGGKASGSVSKMRMINEIGREVMQGGSRRSAIYASLNWRHGDIEDLLHAKDWYEMIIKGAFDENGNPLTMGKAKEHDLNYKAPLDMTNISVNYDNQFLKEVWGKDNIRMHGPGWEEEFGCMGIEILDPTDLKTIPETFIKNAYQALKTAEPGFSFNFGHKENETLRNACTEVTSEDDSDVCNLGSLNMSQFDTLEEWEEAIGLASQFLLCGTLKAHLPYKKIEMVREKNRRLGLGIMGVHEWLLKRGYKYEVVEELRDWLKVYKEVSEHYANLLADELRINRPVAYRSIAPTGTIGILAGTTTGIEPLFAVAFKRRYLKGKDIWYKQFVVDGTAKDLIERHGINPKEIETSLSLAKDYERRIKFQADVQDYVDMSISSTINLPGWGSKINNEDMVVPFAQTLVKYAHRLRGFTCYPDGARGGQPLTSVSYEEAIKNEGKEYVEEAVDVCEITGHGGTCGI